MIDEWNVSNFKSILSTRVINEDGSESNTLIIKPLTIFCGSNSSGKSSLLQSILLIAQTMKHRNKELPLILNGEFTTLGRFEDVCSNIANTFSIQFSYLTSGKYKFYNSYPFYDPFDKEKSTKIFNVSILLDFEQSENDILPKLFDIMFSIDFECGKSLQYIKNESNDSIKINLINTIENGNSYEKQIKSILNTDEEINVYNLVSSNSPAKEKCDLNHFIFENITINGLDVIAKLAFTKFCERFFLYNPIYCIPDDMIDIIVTYNEEIFFDNHISLALIEYIKNDLLKDIHGIENLFNLLEYDSLYGTQWYSIEKCINNILILNEDIRSTVMNIIRDNLKNIYSIIYDSIINVELKLEEGAEDVYFLIGWDRELLLSEIIENLFSEIFSYFSTGISYLGPLREDPMLLYPFSDMSYTNEVGKKGENTAAILELNKNKICEFPTPLFNNSGLYIIKEKSFKESVIEWTKYIGIADDIYTELGQGGFILKVKAIDSGKSSDLTNVGVGVSQVLPIIVMCLSANKGSTLIIEQPELHLHPKMQTKLTDFFIAISQSGRQCIIETHSEHIINALRFRVAKTLSPDDEKIANDIQIYFLQKDKNETIFKSININKYSAVSDWPDGFFDEAQLIKEEIIDAMSNKLERDFPDE